MAPTLIPVIRCMHLRDAPLLENLAVHEAEGRETLVFSRDEVGIPSCITVDGLGQATLQSTAGQNWVLPSDPQVAALLKRAMAIHVFMVEDMEQSEGPSP